MNATTWICCQKNRLIICIGLHIIPKFYFVQTINSFQQKDRQHQIGLEKKTKDHYIYYFRLRRPDGLILIGRLVTEGHEPRQIRKEAAISDLFCVVDRSRSCNFPFIRLPAGSFLFYPSLLYLYLDMLSNRLIFQPSFILINHLTLKY